MSCLGVTLSNSHFLLLFSFSPLAPFAPLKKTNRFSVSPPPLHPPLSSVLLPLCLSGSVFLSTRRVLSFFLPLLLLSFVLS